MEFYLELRLGSVTANVGQIKNICGVHPVEICGVDGLRGSVYSLDSVFEESRVLNFLVLILLLEKRAALDAACLSMKSRDRLNSTAARTSTFVSPLMGSIIGRTTVFLDIGKSRTSLSPGRAYVRKGTISFPVGGTRWTRSITDTCFIAFPFISKHYLSVHVNLIHIAISGSFILPLLAHSSCHYWLIHLAITGSFIFPLLAHSSCHYWLIHLAISGSVILPLLANSSCHFWLFHLCSRCYKYLPLKRIPSPESVNKRSITDTCFIAFPFISKHYLSVHVNLIHIAISGSFILPLLAHSSCHYWLIHLAITGSFILPLLAHSSCHFWLRHLAITGSFILPFLALSSLFTRRAASLPSRSVSARCSLRSLSSSSSSSSEKLLESNSLPFGEEGRASWDRHTSLEFPSFQDLDQ
ncbi:hypothetical protein LXL04_020058 [Taraxacum kok-saghyz]